jgi:hypothetical protein
MKAAKLADSNPRHERQATQELRRPLFHFCCACNAIVSAFIRELVNLHHRAIFHPH